MTPAPRELTTPATDLACRIRHHHEECERAAGEAISHAIAAGELLIEAKAACAHGEWLPWLQEHFPASERTAQTYMRVARNAQRVAGLPLRQAVAELAEPRETTPPREDVAPPAEGLCHVYTRAGFEVWVEPSEKSPGYYHLTAISPGLLVDDDGPASMTHTGRPVPAERIRRVAGLMGFPLHGAECRELPTERVPLWQLAAGDGEPTGYDPVTGFRGEVAA